MILSPTQAATYALRAGFSPQSAVIAVAIAKAESGYNLDAVGDVALEDDTWGPSVGLWQIRTLKASTGNGGFRDVQALTGDPLAQAKAAYSISYHGANFSPWSTFKSGVFRQFLPEAVTAVNEAQKGADSVNPTPPVSFYPTPTGKGYWLVSGGAIYAFGDAEYHGGLEWNGTTWVAVGT